MKKRLPALSYAYPVMMANLAMASWETIFHRTLMIAQGTCSPEEYHRMAAEKAAAMRSSIAAFLWGRGQAAIVAPFLVRARANARRLRQMQTPL